MFKVACIQLSVGPDIQENIPVTEDLIRQAHADGAKFIATPENSCFISVDKQHKFATARPEKDHPLLKRFEELTKELDIWLLAGSVKIPIEGDRGKAEKRLANRSYLFAPDGSIKAAYDKIHLYDVDLPNGEVLRESSEFTPGDKGVLVDIPDFDATFGLTICYDIRFGHFYRDMARQGAALFTVPSAFTVPTGQAHWEVMLRARAIECGAFVLAPAQGGTHDAGSDGKGRKTYGHSMIIDPWGRILAHKNDDNPGLITAEIDMNQVTTARSAIQQLRHDREYKITKISN